ncbi:MAG: hypothetical protein QCI82_07885 [Candidatus Thermoplasmatota archaeon]|nr:hypothetical protein [Candidatus Thermoplasmatota archaeon]
MVEGMDGEKAGLATGIIMSYADAGGKSNDTKRMNRLKHLIRIETGLDLDIDYIRKKVDALEKRRAAIKRRDFLLANVFSEEIPEPELRMGSSFCPRCRRFKNHQKECPFCGHHEVTP